MQAIRSQLRAAFLEQLKSSSELKSLTIKAEPYTLLSPQDLPLITVGLDKATTLTDWTALDGNGQSLEMVEQPIVIKITATGNKLEEKLEQLAAVVSQALAQDEKLGLLVKTLRLEEDAEVTISHEGEQPIGVLTMRFIALYRRPAMELNLTCK